MPFIPTRVHAILDYVMGALLIVVPLAWMNETEPAAAWVPIIIGASVIVYSLITAYEYSIAKLIPMSGHLLLDGIGGAVLAASPWIFGFADQIWIPHVILGALAIGAAIFTSRQPGALRTRRVGEVHDRRPAHTL